MSRDDALDLASLPPDQPAWVLESWAWCQPPNGWSAPLGSVVMQPSHTGRTVYAVTLGELSYHCPRTEPPFPHGPYSNTGPTLFSPGMRFSAYVTPALFYSTDGGAHWKKSAFRGPDELIGTDGNVLIAGLRSHACHKPLPLGAPGSVGKVAAEALTRKGWRFLTCVPYWDDSYLDDSYLDGLS